MGMTKKELLAEIQPILDEVGGFLREMREKINYSQKDLAEYMGTCQNQISVMENAKVNPSLGYLAWYSGQLGYNLEVSFSPIEDEEDETA